MDEVVETLVPVETWGTAKGLATGGILDVVHPEVMLRGKARDLPERIEVDVSELLLGESITIAELKLPAGIEATSSPTEPVVIVHQPRGQDAEDTETAEAPEEPEVIGSENKEE